MRPETRRVARFGLLTALALILGLLDRAIPLAGLLGGALPGVKLGLANTVLLYAVYWMSAGEAVMLMLTKVFLSGFLFGSLSAILYSLAGGALSLAVMLAMRRKRTGGRIMATSVAGATAHNIGQVLAAAAALRTPGLLATYLPPLTGIGAAVGCLTGAVAWRVFRALSGTEKGRKDDRGEKA